AWKALASDEGATYDKVLTFDVSTLEPQVTWGSNPGMGAGINGTVPDPETLSTEVERRAARQALAYMGLDAGMKIPD
ncbi:MAG: aconitase family protein, partial [Firmicutes bacterium]|nr:aconitase family protein [Bacillota bacterium]